MEETQKTTAWYEIVIPRGTDDIGDLENKTVYFTRLNGIDHAKFIDLIRGDSNSNVNFNLLGYLTSFYQDNLEFVETVPHYSKLKLKVWETEDNKIMSRLTCEYELDQE
jgi:hypothetical protein